MTPDDLLNTTLISLAIAGGGCFLVALAPAVLKRWRAVLAGLVPLAIAGTFVWTIAVGFATDLAWPPRDSSRWIVWAILAAGLAGGVVDLLPRRAWVGVLLAAGVLGTSLVLMTQPLLNPRHPRAVSTWQIALWAVLVGQAGVALWLVLRAIFRESLLGLVIVGLWTGATAFIRLFATSSAKYFQQGSVIAFAVAGIALASLVARRSLLSPGGLLVIVIAVVLLLADGLLWGRGDAALLLLILLAPLNAGVVRLPGVRSWPLWTRWLLAIIAVAGPLAMSIGTAQQQYTAAQQPSRSTPSVGADARR